MRALAVCTLFSFFNVGLLICQNSNLDYFDSPIKYPIKLISNFGEIRPNHFHSGFDISTGGQEGVEVFAIADGYVSRIKISASGYGRAIYITHPNGYTSVYGHLKSFSNFIESKAKTLQYTNKSFEIDTILTPIELPIKKGELIALSGNTGSSEGPHLHFEIRETISEMIVNPLLFGYKIADIIAPVITKVALYSENKNALIPTIELKKKVNVIKQGDNFKLLNIDTLNIYSPFAIGVECYDTENNSTNKNAIYSMELLLDGKEVYSQKFEKFSFENSRYVNAHIDYADKQRNNSKFQKCFLAKNNLSGIYNTVVNDGIIELQDTKVHLAKLIVSDYFGNASELNFKVKAISETKPKLNSLTPSIIFDCTKENNFKNDSISFSFPIRTFYNDLVFSFSSIATNKFASPIYAICNNSIAVQKAYSFSIKIPHYDSIYKNKYAIVSISKEGKEIFEGGTTLNGWITCKTKLLGKFAVILDTIPPHLAPMFLAKSKTQLHFSKQSLLQFKLSDLHSEIKNYSVKIDDNWYLAEYDLQRNILSLQLNDITNKGKHQLLVEIADKCGNTKVWKTEFIFD